MGVVRVHRARAQGVCECTVRIRRMRLASAVAILTNLVYSV